MPTVSEQLLSKIYEGQELFTPTKRSKFTILYISPYNIIVKLRGGYRIRIPVDCFDAIFQHFPRGKWILIGAREDQPDADTLDQLVQRYTIRPWAASYVAPLLEAAGFAEIDRRRPTKIRLK